MKFEEWEGSATYTGELKAMYADWGTERSEYIGRNLAHRKDITELVASEQTLIGEREKLIWALEEIMEWVDGGGSDGKLFDRTRAVLSEVKEKI